MSNFIIRQEGPSSVVADNIWEVRLGVGSLLFGVLAGALGGALVGLVLGRRGQRGGGTRGASARLAKDWPVNIAHRGGAGIAPENTIEGFREGLSVGAGCLELDVHTTADGHVVVMHDERVDRTTNGSGPIGKMTLSEVKGLDAGYRFTQDGGRTYPYRGQGVAVPTLEEVYREFGDVPINVEIKEKSHSGTEEAVWRVIEDAGAGDRTLVVSEKLPTIRRFRETSGGRVATASSLPEIIAFDLLTRLRLSRLLRPSYQALQGPERYCGLHIVTPDFVEAAHALGIRVDVWTIDSEPDMRRLLDFGVDGIMTDQPYILARVLEESG
jgi:glycerophosphoryl diester phosphodiesterase